MNKKLKNLSGQKLHSSKRLRRIPAPKKEIPQSIFWMAGIVFGMAVVAEAQSKEEWEEKNSDAFGDASILNDIKINHEQQFNLGPNTRVLLAELANEPISDAPTTTLQLNNFFKNWFLSGLRL